MDASARHTRRFVENLLGFIACAFLSPENNPPPRATLRHATSFSLPNDTLSTPMLVLSNTYDPVTPLLHARMANDRVGNNARLIEQNDAYGHCVLSVASICTARRVREFMVEGKVQEENHLLCDVEEKPFQDSASGSSVALTLDQNDIATWEAWKELVRLGIDHQVGF
jgi:hypothetical protein